MKAVTCTESLAMVGWSCANDFVEQDSTTIKARVISIPTRRDSDVAFVGTQSGSDGVEAGKGFFIKMHLLIRFRFFIGGLALSSLHRLIELVKNFSALLLRAGNRRPHNNHSGRVTEVFVLRKANG